MSTFDRKKALDKIRKLLRLSASSNANEAAIALRQAQKMMEQYAIDAADVGDCDVEPIIERHASRQGKTPPVYAVRLQALIARAFGLGSYCYAKWNLSWRRSAVFVGPTAQAEMACYAYVVLLRQLERDRRAHLSRVRKAANRAARGDQFGLAWVTAVSALVGQYAGEVDPRIAAYLESAHPDMKSFSPQARAAKGQDKLAWNDRYAGSEAGKRAQLARGVTGAGQRMLEGL
jgi:hypothetical protein